MLVQCAVCRFATRSTCDGGEYFKMPPASPALPNDGVGFWILLSAHLPAYENVS
jgi:hypothetical protein